MNGKINSAIQEGVLGNALIVRVIEELKISQVPIDSYLKGYLTLFQERINIEEAIDQQKRIYIFFIRLLLKSTHKQLRTQLIEDYRKIVRENEEILKEQKKLQKLEKEDSKVFDEWAMQEKQPADDEDPPILDKYRKYMEVNRILPTDNGIVINK